MARLHYGDERLVAVKLSAWKGSGTHPKHVRARNRTGEATVKLVVGHGNHDGANNVGDGALVAAVDTMVKQQGTKHHDKHGIAGATPSKSKDAPWSAGHGDAHSTAVLPAARKERCAQRFPGGVKLQGLVGWVRKEQVEL